VRGTWQREMERLLFCMTYIRVETSKGEKGYVKFYSKTKEYVKFHSETKGIREI
jgi:hypothetical protein